MRNYLFILMNYMFFSFYIRKNHLKCIFKIEIDFMLVQGLMNNPYMYFRVDIYISLMN